MLLLLALAGTGMPPSPQRISNTLQLTPGTAQHPQERLMVECNVCYGKDNPHTHCVKSMEEYEQIILVKQQETAAAQRLQQKMTNRFREHLLVAHQTKGWHGLSSRTSAQRDDPGSSNVFNGSRLCRPTAFVREDRPCQPLVWCTTHLLDHSSPFSPQDMSGRVIKEKESLSK